MRCLYRASRVVRGFTSGFLSRTSSSVASTVNLQDARPFEEIPGPKGQYNIPVIGAMFHFKPFTDFSLDYLPPFYDKIMQQYGPLVRIRLGEWMVMVEHPSDIEMIYRSEGKYPRRMTFVLQRIFCEKHDVPESISDIDGEDWQRFRNPLNPLMMRTKSAQHYLPVQNEVADDLVEELSKPLSPQQSSDLFYRYACESISAVCFNQRLGYLRPDVNNDPEKLQTLEDIQIILEKTTKSIRRPSFYIQYFPNKIKKRYFERRLRVFKKFKEHYTKSVKVLEQKQRDGTLDVNEHNFIMSLMTSGKMTPGQMASIAFTMFVGGTDSTARTLQIILYNLAKNPDKQDKLYQEVHSILGDSGPLTEQALGSMSYLQACLKESFRVNYPISSGMQRYLPNDIILQGYRIPAGTSILMMNQRIIKDPKYFPEPESFIPERWLRDEDGKRSSNIPPTALLPFSFGKRMCLGKRFAEQEIYLAVTKILQKYRVSVPAGDDGALQVSYTPFAGPREPVTFTFHERNPS